MSDECNNSSCSCTSDCSSCSGGCSTDTEHSTITLTMEDNTEVECAILTIFPVDAQEYIALLPLDNEDGEVYLYRYSEDANGEPSLDNIESDEEYEIVSDAFDEYLDSAEYDELYFEEDEESEEE